MAAPVHPGALDEPVPGATWSLGYALVRGWALSESRVSSVRIRINGRPVAPARVGLPRPDVAAEIDRPEAALCGFEGHLDLSRCTETGEASVDAEVTRLDGTTYVLGPIPVRIGGPTPGPRMDVPLPPVAAAVDRSAVPAGPPRVLVLSHDLSRGGAQLRMVDYLRHMGPSDTAQFTVVSQKDGPVADDLAALGVPVQIVGSDGRESAGAYEEFVGELVALISDGCYSVFWANTLVSFPGVDAALRAGVPSLWFIHEGLDPALFWGPELDAGRTDPHAYQRCLIALRSATVVVCVARAARRTFERYRQGPIVVLPNSVDVAAIAAYRATHDRQAARRHIGVAPNERLVLSCAPIAPHKGQALLAQALADQVASHPETVCAMVGDFGHPYAEGIAAYAERVGLGSRLRMAPLTDDVYPWFQAADLFVLPSDDEALASVVLEAMAFEVPVVSTDVAGMPEVVDDGATGFLCRPGDVAALSETLDQVLSAHPAVLRDITDAALRRVKERHDIAARAAILRGLIADLAGSEVDSEAFRSDERSAADLEERLTRLSWTRSEQAAELRRRASEMATLREERAVEAERAAEREESLAQQLGLAEARATAAEGEVARLAGELHRLRASRSWRLAELASAVKNSRGRPTAIRRAMFRWRIGPIEPAPPAPVPPALPVTAAVAAPMADSRCPAVSVVLPARPGDTTLADVIGSLETQTLSGLEIVVRDAGLRDDELAWLLGRLRRFDRVVVASGVGGQAEEEARRLAGGRYRCELDPPVLLHPTFLEKAALVLDAQPDIGFVYSWVNTSGGEVWPTRALARPGSPVGSRPPCTVARRDTTDLSASPGRVIAEPLVSEPGRPPAPTARPKPAPGLRPLVLTLPWFTLGGGDRVVEALLRHWRDRGRHVVAITTVELGAGMVDRFGELLDLTPFAYHLPRLLPPPEWPAFLAGVVTSLDGPTLLNIGSPWIYGALPELRSRFPGVRVVDQQFNDIGHLPANRQARGSIDVTVAAYTQLAETIRSDGRTGQVEVVPVGIPPLRPVDECDVKALRQSLDIPEHHRIVSFVGRLSTEKRPEWALALAADLAEDDDVTVLLVGDGPLADVLRPGIGAVPRLVWRRSVERVEHLLALTDVMIIPSRIEGIPLVAMEALTLGVPVIATRVGGLPEIEDDPLVELCEPDDFPGFVRAVRAAVSGAGGDRQYRPDVFSLQVMLDHYDRLIEGAGG